MSTHVDILAPPRAPERVHPQRWHALFVLLFAAVMDLIDGTSVNVAIPSIQRDLRATYAAIQWVVAGYALAFAVLLITGGRLGDIYGRKRLFLAGVCGFSLASALCSAAPTAAALIVARTSQGAMAAMMVPQILSIIQVTFPERERGAAFGAYGAVLGLAGVAGPIVGGLLLQADVLGLGWRMIFLVNVLGGVVTFVAASRVVPESRARHALKLDLAGVILLTLGLVLLLYPLTQGGELGWPAWIVAVMAAAVPVLTLFIIDQRRKAGIDGSPLVAPRLFRQRAFVAGLLVTLIVFAVIAAFFLVLALDLQIGSRFTPLSTGLTILPFSIAGAAGSATSIKLAPKLGRRIIGVGTLVIAGGIAGCALRLGGEGARITPVALLLPMLISGLGLGLVIAPLADIVLAGVPEQDAGGASGVFNTTNQLGSAAGVALVGVVFFTVLTGGATLSAEHTIPQIRHDLTAHGIPEAIQDQIVQRFRTCFRDRVATHDPAGLLAGCRQAREWLPTAALSSATNRDIEQAIGTAAAVANVDNFARATRRMFWYLVGALLGSSVLTFLLPARPRRTRASDDRTRAGIHPSGLHDRGET